MRRIERAAVAIAVVCSIYAQDGANTIRVPVRLVVVPTLVLSPRGRVVSGLEAKDFRVLDNGIRQEVAVRSDSVPASIAIAVQTDDSVSDYLPFVKRTGALLESLLMGEGGRSALVSYGDEVRVIQGFGTGPRPRRW